MAYVTSAQIALWAKQRGLDPAAVLSVAQQEGLGGGVGDNGTSFGPWQLHYGGAYPSWAPQGQEASQDWAWSPEGVGYALDQIKGVASGLTGRPAVENIVRRFERPANPDREVQGALGAYGGAQPPAAAPVVAASVAPSSTTAAPARAGPPLSARAPERKPSRQLPAVVQAALDILRG